MKAKKLAAVALSLCLTVPMFSTIVSAADGSLMFSDPQTKVGEEVSVDLVVRSDDSAVGDWDVSYLGNSFTSPEDTGVDYFIQSQGVNNFARLKDDELDSYLAAGAYTADKDASAAAYLKAYVRQAELCAYLPTDGVQTYCLRNKKVKGLNTSSTFIWSQSMATAYIDD